MSDKKQLRKQILELRDTLTKDEIIEKSKVIRTKLYKLPEYTNSKTLFIYVNMGSEVETIPIIEDAWKQSKTVCVPVMKRMGEMHFVELRSLDELKLNNYGILEPILDETLVRTPDEDTLCVSPLVAYNKENYRIGYGGGFYDRYLAKYTDLKAVGLAFTCQYLEHIPLNEYDMPLSHIISE